MRKVMLIMSVLMLFIGSSFAGGKWLTGYSTNNVCIEQTNSGTAICFFSAQDGNIYGFFMNVSGAPQMYESLKVAASQALHISIWMSSTSSTISYVDLAGNSQTYYKADAINLLR